MARENLTVAAGSARKLSNPRDDMLPDRTQTQAAEEQVRSQQLSIHRARPPAEVPGYEARRFLGAGAYGEVWVAVDRNTGRQVAIKYYAHRGGLDWSLLLREVEKLAFLSADRYVVQLLEVGWDSDPPYYVMEYVEQGSLDDRIKSTGALPAEQAVSIFREVAVGLLHAHAKGVLHCDLKPANVLLDQDDKPRLADFGQSRLSHEQTPALGTLFYMAPEQADLEAVPDARWDVYALGALLYCMLTGGPPHKTDLTVTEIESAKDLPDRLARYRQALAAAPLPQAHRRVAGVDRPLADIIDGCLAPNPDRRYPNVQSVFDALDSRAQRKARRPLVVLGAVGPALLLLVMTLLTWQWFNTAVRHSTEELTERVLESNRLTASFAAKTAASELEIRFRAIEQIASDVHLQAAMEDVLEDEALEPILIALSDPTLSEEQLEPLRTKYRKNPKVLDLNRLLAAKLEDSNLPNVASWILNDPRGLQLARAARATPEQNTVGVNWAFRSYFHGGLTEKDRSWRPTDDDDLLDSTHLSSVFRSQATHHWAVGISTPVVKRGEEEEYLGVLALTIDLGNFVSLQHPDDENPSRVSVLVDWREGEDQGLILQHPLLDRLYSERGMLPREITEHRVTPEGLPDGRRRRNYADPLAAMPEGDQFAGRWLAEMAPVRLGENGNRRDTGWIVIVQESYDEALGNTLTNLKRSLASSAAFALAMVVLVITALWVFVVRPLARNPLAPVTAAPRASRLDETLPAMDRGQARRGR